MDRENLCVAFALTGSFCTFSKVIPEIEKIKKAGIDIIPIMSYSAFSTDTRFGESDYFIRKIEEITGNKILTKIKEVEPLGPKKMADALIIAPATSSTISRLSVSDSGTAVTLSAKSLLRNNCPIIIAVSTNDGLSGSAENIGRLLNRKNFYFVPFSQDDYKEKPFSLVADMTKIFPTLTEALKGKQIQPLLQ